MNIITITYSINGGESLSKQITRKGEITYAGAARIVANLYADEGREVKPSEISIERVERAVKG